jgi:DNA-binding NarL/FixJ family response regulator
VVADDHPGLLDEIRALLTPEFEIVGSVSNGLDLIGSVRDSKPDVVVSDIQMSGISGIEACRRIIQEGLCGAAIILTMYSEAQLVRDALRAGIRGYVSKVDAGEELIPALRSVVRGSTYFSRGVRKGRSE